MSRNTLATSAIAAAFALLALTRLNGLSLLEPDTPEYFFGAQSLAHFEGYRELDGPGAPPQTFRPPGLSLMLVPLAWAKPYGVVPAKVLLLAVTLGLLFQIAALAARGGPPWGAPAAMALVASSPYTLLHATEVVTEIPYLVVSLAVILIVTRREGQPALRDLVLATGLLAFLPFLRTIGLSLVLALALWCVADRRRRSWWPAPAIALAGTAGWMIRNHLAGGPTYFGAIAADLERLGLAAFAAKAAGAAAFYASRVVAVLLPGILPGRPLFERMTIGGTPDLGSLGGTAWPLGGAIVAFAAWGALARRKTDGALLALYAGCFLVVLAIYPPRHERLTWPLVPLVWAIAPTGFAACEARVRARRFGHRALVVASTVVVVALLCWQGAAGLAMARDNLAFVRGGDRFYDDRVPPLYFADWPAAGRWLREHAPEGSRVLTRHSDLGFTSGRQQESVRFEELPPSAWRTRIAKSGARYLAVPSSLYGKFFPFSLLAADPAYDYTVLHESRNVAIIEVAPNRTGRVRVPAPPPLATIEACETLLGREPERVDLAVRCAELRADGGDRDGAISRLGRLVEAGGADVRVEVALGQILLDAGRSGEAVDAFSRAARLPEAELLAQTIQRGLDSARSRAGRGEQDARGLCAIARGYAESLRWGAALEAAEEAVRRAPADPDALTTLAGIDLRLGFEAKAQELYDAASAADPRAREKAAGLRSALAVEASLSSASPGTIVRAAAFWAGDGVPGRALALLERARTPFPDEATISARLSDLERFYGLPAR